MAGIEGKEWGSWKSAQLGKRAGRFSIVSSIAQPAGLLSVKGDVKRPANNAFKKSSQEFSAVTRYLYSRYYKWSHGVWILHARIHVFKQSETILKYSQPLAFTSQSMPSTQTRNVQTSINHLRNLRGKILCTTCLRIPTFSSFLKVFLKRCLQMRPWILCR